MEAQANQVLITKLSSWDAHKRNIGFSACLLNCALCFYYYSKQKQSFMSPQGAFELARVIYLLIFPRLFFYASANNIQIHLRFMQKSPSHPGRQIMLPAASQL